MWEMTIEEEQMLPNGEYEVYAKVEGADGDQESERTEFKIAKSYDDQKADLNDEFGEMDPDLDFDGDGLSNSDEKRLETNPYLADTDNDGYIDGDEVRNGFNPLKSSEGNRSDEIVFETPK